MIGDFLAAWPSFSANARRFLVSATLAGFAYSGVYFLLANLFLVRLGYEESFIGLFIATGAASFALFSLPAGIAGRRWGPRPVMLGGYVVLLLGLTLMALAPLLPAAWRPAWLLTFCALRELGNACYIVNANPFLMDSTGGFDRRFVFAARGAVVPLAGFLGALAGGALPGWSATWLGRAEADPITYMVPLLLGGLLLIPGGLVLTGTTAEHTEGVAPPLADEPEDTTPLAAEPLPVEPVAISREAGRSADPFPTGPIVTMAAVGLFYVAAMASAMSFFNLYLDQALGVSTERIGTVLATGQLLAAPTGLLLAPLSARIGYDRAFILCAVGVAAGAAMMGGVEHWLAAAAGTVTIVSMSAIAFPAITVYQQELVSIGWRPVISGTYMMCVAVGWTITASGGGVLIDIIGYRSIFLAGAMLTSLGIAIFAVYSQMIAPRPDQTPAG